MSINMSNWPKPTQLLAGSHAVAATALDQPQFLPIEHPQEEGNVLCEQPTSSHRKVEMDKVAEDSKPREQKNKRSRICKGTEVWETPWVLGVAGGSLLQEHHSRGERCFSSHIIFHTWSWAGLRQ